MSRESPLNRSYMMPFDLCDRPSSRRLKRTFTDWFELWNYLLRIAREALQEGRLVIGDEPVTKDDLEFSRDAIPPGFVDSCVREQMLTVDDDGCYRIARWSEYYRWNCKMPEVQAQQKRNERARKKESENVGTVAELVGTESESKKISSEDVRACLHTSINHHPSANNHQPTTPSFDRSFSECAPEAPEQPERTKEFLSLSLVVFHELKPTGQWTPKTQEQALAFASEGLQKDIEHGPVTPDDIGNALRWGAQLTKAKVDRGEPTTDPWKYCLSAASERISAVLQHRRLEDVARARGRPMNKPAPWLEVAYA